MSDATAKKEERRKFQAIRGVRDLLPPETALWTRVEQTAREVFAAYNFGEIRLPIFEQTELFARAVGGETDIVSKEMYTFERKVDAFRHSFLRVSSDIPDAGSLMIALQGLAVLNENVERGLEVDQLATNEDNRATSKELHNLTYALIDLWNKGDREPSPKWRESLQTARTLAWRIDAGDSESLRPEATAGVCRAYIEHNMQQLPQPVKLYYMGPMFRRERPQKGRYRQFYQIGAEILGGSDAPAIDAEVIEMLMTFFDRCGLQGATLYINSIGHNADNCRRGYVEQLRAELTKIKDELGADSQRRIDTNPLRVLDSKLEHEQPYIEKLPHIADYLCDDCKANYAGVKRELDLRGVTFHENWRLVRGLDYYTRTAFEITAPGLGSQNAVCGGGRYDGLIELLGGPPTKATGFAIGEDRLILSLLENEKAKQGSGGESGVRSALAARRSALIYIAWMGEEAYASGLRAAKTLRNAGFAVELPPAEQKFGKALGQADKLGARYALILGDNEVQSGQWTLKTLATGEQSKIPEQDLLQFLGAHK